MTVTNSGAGGNGRNSVLLLLATGLALTLLLLFRNELEWTGLSAATEHGADSCGALYAKDVARWRHRACQRQYHVAQTLNLTREAGKPMWDSWEPEAGCPVEDRVGKSYWGDGPKFLCGAEFLADRPDCLVYSIGANNDDGFEQGLLSVAPHCEVSTVRVCPAAAAPCNMVVTSDQRVRIAQLLVRVT